MSVFPSILSVDIDWPPSDKFDFDPDCKDLIKSLLKFHPEERLGCPGTANDIKALQAHPFFAGIDFTCDITKQLDPKKALLDQEIAEMIEKGLDPD